MEKKYTRIIAFAVLLLLVAGVLGLSSCSKKSPPEPVDNMSLVSGYDEKGTIFIEATWDPVEDAEGYYASIKSTINDCEYLIMTIDTATVFCDLAYDTVYTITVKVVILDWRGTQIFSEPTIAEIRTNEP